MGVIHINLEFLMKIIRIILQVFNDLYKVDILDQTDKLSCESY